MAEEGRERTTSACPLLVDLTGRICVVVGGGGTAARRAQTLAEGGADVRVIATEVGIELAQLARRFSLVVHERPYRDGDLQGAFIAVAATGDNATDEAVGREARALGCLFNAASGAEAGDTHFLAEVRRGHLRIAVSTSGASPTVAGAIRREIEERFGPEWEPYLDSLAALRSEALQRVVGKRERQALLGLAADRHLMRRVIEAGPEGASALLEQLLVEAGEGRGTRAWVSLVGAGPGDPELITTKGLDRLRRCDVVIYDHLVDADLVHQAPMHAERIYVGKRGGHDYIKQPEIERLLVAKAREEGGRHVVRLKGGDPYVFGRGGEEALALRAAEIPFEVVPGVTSGVAAPAWAGIPVTHRGLSTSVTFVTGHEDPSKGRDDVDWARVGAGAETICVYMGVRNAASIASQLIAGGRPADDPVAVIRWGTTTRQQTVVSTLEKLGEAIEESGVTPPALLVIGPVVGVRGLLGDNRPLPGDGFGSGSTA